MAPFLLLFIVSMGVSISSNPQTTDQLNLVESFSYWACFQGKSWDLPLLCHLQYVTGRRTPPLPALTMVPSLCGWEAVEKCDPHGRVWVLRGVDLICRQVFLLSTLAWVGYSRLKLWSQSHVPKQLDFESNRIVFCQEP